MGGEGSGWFVATPCFPTAKVADDEHAMTLGMASFLCGYTSAAAMSIPVSDPARPLSSGKFQHFRHGRADEDWPGRTSSRELLFTSLASLILWASPACLHAARGFGRRSGVVCGTS